MNKKLFLLPLLALLGSAATTSCSAFFTNAEEVNSFSNDIEENEIVYDKNAYPGNNNPTKVEVDHGESTKYDNISTYTITWRDYDGTILKVDQKVKRGTLPSFDEEIPSFKKDDSTFDFIGWEPEITQASSDATYTAKYKETSNKYSFEEIKDENFNAYAYRLSAINDNNIDEEITLPQTFNNLPVIEVGNYFSSWNNVKKVIIPEGYQVIRSGAFINETQIVDVILPSTIKEIKNDAFNNTGIKNISLLGNINSVEQNAFANCSKLEKVTINCNIDTLSEGLFQNCYNLKEVNLNNINYIGNKAFKGCESLLEFSFENIYGIGDSAFANSGLFNVFMPDSVTSLGQGVFENCYSLESIRLSNNLTSIPFETFSKCSNLTHISIPENITSIEKRAFIFAGLRDIELNDNINKIGLLAFYGNESLRTIRIPQNVTALRESVFASCSNLRVVSLPNTLTTINKNAFDYCYNLVAFRYQGNRNDYQAKIMSNLSGINPYFNAFEQATVIENGYEEISEYNKNKNKTIIVWKNDDNSILDVEYKNGEISYKGSTPSKEEDEDYTYTFSNWSTTTDEQNNVIERKANYIANQKYFNVTFDFDNGNKVTQRLKSDEKIVYPDVLPQKNNYLFLGWDSSLTNMPKRDLTIKALYSSKSVSGLSYLENNNGINVIKNKSIETLINEGQLTTINEDGVNYLSNYVNKTYKNVGKGNLVLNNIAQGVSLSGTKLINVIVPNGYSKIKGIDRNDYLLSIELPSTINSLATDCFARNKLLKKVDLSKTSITEISIGAFSSCENLEDVQLNSSITKIGKEAFENNKKLKHINLPNSITTLDEQAFWNTGLVKISLPNKLKEISVYCFADNTSLEEINIPSSVTKISDGAFYRCDKLTKVNYSGSASSFNNITFGYGNEKISSANKTYNYAY